MLSLYLIFVLVHIYIFKVSKIRKHRNVHNIIQESSLLQNKTEKQMAFNFLIDWLTVVKTWLHGSYSC